MLNMNLFHHKAVIQWRQYMNSLGESYGGTNTLRQVMG
jgi:hypothetical protein